MFIYPSNFSQEIWEQKKTQFLQVGHTDEPFWSMKWCKTKFFPPKGWRDSLYWKLLWYNMELELISTCFSCNKKRLGDILFLCWCLIRPCATLFSTISAVTRQCQTLKLLKMTCQTLPPKGSQSQMKWFLVIASVVLVASGLFFWAAKMLSKRQVHLLRPSILDLDSRNPLTNRAASRSAASMADNTMIRISEYQF